MRNNSIIFRIALLAIFLFTTPLLLASAQTSQSVLNTNSYAPADSSIPQKGTTFTDPNFHTNLVRITDKTDGYSGAGIENEYAKMDPENSEGKYVILRGNDGEWYLYDTSNFQMKKQLNIVDGVEPEPRWDAIDPNVFYYIYETELRTYNIETDLSASVHNFKIEFSSAAYITTGSEGDASLDRRFWSFIVKDSEYNFISTVVFDKESNNVVGQKADFPDELDWISMDMSGSHCIVGYDTYSTQVFSRDFSSIIDLPLGANGHMDLALSSEGNDVMVYQNTQTDWIAMADLNTGSETQLVEIPFGENSDIGLHFSGNCAEKPGWALVSTYGAKNPPPNEKHTWMDTQIFMLELKQNPTVWRIAHTHAYTSKDYVGEKNYFAEAFATINKAGTRVYFGSNWDDYTAEYTDTYQAVLTSELNTPTVTPTQQPQTNSSIPTEYIAIATIAIIVPVAVAAVVLMKRNS